MGSNDNRRPPMWMTVIMIVMLLPLFSWPFVVSDYPEGKDEYLVLLYLFPIYALLSVYCAYKTYVARKELSIIILSLLMLSYIACAWWLIA